MIKVSRYLLPIFVIFYIAALFRAYIISIIYPIPNLPDNLFITSLLGFEFRFAWWFTFLIGLGNLLLIWLIGKKIFSQQVAYLWALLYAISPWTAYLDVTGSIYIFLLFCILILCLGVLTINLRKNKLGLILTSASFVVLLYSSLISWLALPTILIIFRRLKFLSLQHLKVILFVCAPCYLVLVILCLINMTGFINEFHQLVIINDLNLINSVNHLRGELKDTEFVLMARLIENKYIFFGQYLIFSLLSHLTPATYFTPQEKLLGFSFSPPILLGFLFPFIFGLKYLFDLLKKFGIASLSLVILMLPSLFSNQPPDLTRLVLLSPILYLIISWGFLNELLHKKFLRFLLIGSIALIIIQFFLILFDLANYEWIRVEKYMWQR